MEGIVLVYFYLFYSRFSPQLLMIIILGENLVMVLPTTMAFEKGKYLQTHHLLLGRYLVDIIRNFIILYNIKYIN